MSESVTKEAPTLANKATSTKTKKSLLSFKEALFQNITVQEAQIVLDKMFYDFLSSDYADDSYYRSEVVFFKRFIGPFLESINEAKKVNLKKEFFEETSSKEFLQCFDKLTYDILGSLFANDNMYRNDILVLQTLIHKAIVGIDQDIDPNDIYVLQITIEY